MYNADEVIEGTLAPDLCHLIDDDGAPPIAASPEDETSGISGGYTTHSRLRRTQNQAYIPTWHEKSRSGYLGNRLFKILIIGKVDRFFLGPVQELLECLEFMFLGSRVIIKFIKYDHSA
jgi:hypothetical protein